MTYLKTQRSPAPIAAPFCSARPLHRPVEKRRAGRHRDFGKSLKRNGYRVGLASITLAAALCAASTPCASQDGERPSVRNVSPPKVIRTYRPRIGADFLVQRLVQGTTKGFASRIRPRFPDCRAARVAQQSSHRRGRRGPFRRAALTGRADGSDEEPGSARRVRGRDNLSYRAGSPK